MTLNNKKAYKRRWFCILIFFLLCFPGCKKIQTVLLTETRTVDSGEFYTLKIGSDKSQVLEKIKDLGVEVMKPIPTIKFYLSAGNNGDIDLINKSDGIRVNVPIQNMYVDLFFVDGSISVIKKSMRAENYNWFKKGESVYDVKMEIFTLFKTEPGIEVFPIVDYSNNDFIYPSKFIDADIKSLFEKYDAWEFEIPKVKPAGAYFEIYFDAGRLTRIDYRRPRTTWDL